ncbi:hypothetical protein MAR_014562 [Mya arenaria]|uniref:Transposase n=1 Tax=Mya arenaria TaxID=6604 RepID=A0ABY7G327_MYAAR|nr:hypothetical protein MAR_014562 [Mya arenaria]
MADRGNILNELTNQQLVDRYRFNRAGLNYLETVFGPALEPATMRHKSLSAMDKLLITLRSHKITRAKVERGIGQLKRRFGVLHGEVRVQPEKACSSHKANGDARNIATPMTA